MSRDRPYYSVRTGKNPQGGGFGLTSALRLFLSAYEQLNRDGYFQEYFGFACVDAGFTPGTLGEDIEAAILLDLRKEGLWPVREKIEHYSEDDFFDMVEYLYDHATEGDKGYFHGFNDCGWHFESFKTDDSGKREFRSKINRVLGAYGQGYGLDEGGEIFSLPEPGYENILSANLPSNDPENIEAKVQEAIYKFTRARSTLNERRDAIRDLVDVLEFLRPQLKSVLDSEDESDLFNIANNFGIRHHNQNQKTNYDRNVWYSWLLYYYLSTIHAALRLIEKRS